MIYLDFEKKIKSLDDKILELKEVASNEDMQSILTEVKSLETKKNKFLESLYKNLSPWEKVQVARHPLRPHALHYIQTLTSNFIPLAGDRSYAEDNAIIGGIGTLKNGTSVMMIGIEKGVDTESRIKHNFGMPYPEGYKKASRLMKLADKFSLPIITLIDTSGAYPGEDAEQRGQGQAIAQAIKTCLNITTPLISIVIGEGGSGGAVAIGAGDAVLMLEHSIYSVISPEACASILYKNSNQAISAAKSLKLTAQDLVKLKVIDDIIPEIKGGAHRNKYKQSEIVQEYIYKHLSKLESLSSTQRKERKHNKYLSMGS